MSAAGRGDATTPRPTGPATSPAGSGPRGVIEEAGVRRLAAATPFEVFRQLESSPKGLTEAEANSRGGQAGELGAEPAPTATARLGSAAANPFVVLLACLGVVFVLVGDIRGGATVVVVVAASVAVRWWQQLRSDRAMRLLRARVHATATVYRRASSAHQGVRREVPVEDVVVGDVVVLGPGDLVPSDVRLLEADDLRVDQSMLSGEFLAARKSAPASRRPVRRRAASRYTAAAHPDLVDLASVCFAGTSVVSGSGKAVAIATGAGTYFGALSRAALAARPRSSVDAGVRAVGTTLIRFMLIMAPIVFLVNGTLSGDWTRAALFAMAVAVGLTPEMLPVIVSATLARGAVRLARRGVLVKRLDAIQDLGAMDVLCVDKTGTLTEDRVVATHSIDLDGRVDDTAAEYAFLAGCFQAIPGDRLDQAIADHVGNGAAPPREPRYSGVDEIEFDHQRRRSTVIVRSRAGDHIMITKGDPDVVLGLCAKVRLEGDPVALSPRLLRRGRDCVAAHQANGMRVLAVAAKRCRARGHPYGAPDETGLTFVGFVAFVDPVKESTDAALRQLAEQGIPVKVLTGDAPRVVEQVCRQAGIPVGEIVLGQQVERATDRALRAVVARTTVFAKVNPHHKARIVAALRAEGHCVGFLGDGVNDATALRTSDVGICVDTGTDAARTAADLVLLHKDLGVLADGVLEGRRTLGNTMKYVKITAASNFGNVFSVLAASAFLPFLPMLPIQLIVQNLLYDATQLALPWDSVERNYLHRPRRWDAGGLSRFMLVFGPLSSIFDLCTFACLWWVLGVDSPAQQATFQAAWFTESLLSQVLVVLLLRGHRAGVPALPVLVATALAVVAGIALPLSPLAGPLRMSPPPHAYAVWLAAILAGYLLAAQLAKIVYVRRAGAWL